MEYEKLCECLEDELEQEYLKRTDEMRSFENFLSLHSDKEEFNEQFRKMLIVMRYAHYEGYCKNAFTIYVNYINRSEALISNCKYQIMASSLYNEFDSIMNQNNKPVDLGDRKLKQDESLQTIGRRCQFCSAYDSIIQQRVNISESIVNTEANLRSHVLKGIMYKLSLDFQIVDSYQNTINRLVNLRNNIAHGDFVRGIDEKQYRDYKEGTSQIMKMIRDEIVRSYREKRYLKVVS